jgi:hypothetical protein
VDPVETERRPSVKIHLAMLAALALYGLLLAQVRTRMSANLSVPVLRMNVFLPMLVFGVVQFAVLSALARRRLRSPIGQPAGRARAYFVIRAASAEAIALLGLLIGFQGAPILQAAALLALALAAMLSSFPTREAWQNALREAQIPNP